MSARKTPLLVALLSIPTLAVLTAPAMATQNSSTNDTAEALSNAGTIVTQENITPTDNSTEYMSDTGNNVVTMPHQASNEVRVSDKDPDDSDVKITLPNNSTTVNAELSPVGGVTYESSDHGTTVLPKSDGSVQIATTINSADSPSDYTYTFTESEGSYLRMEDDGSVSVIGADGTWEGGIAAPWARDANGNTIPTSYSVDGNKLTQHVSFNNDTAFPVVADPWWGGDLIDHTEWADEWQWSPTLKVYPSLWGRVAPSFLVFTAWEETLDETERTGHPDPDTSSMFNQFKCHWDWARVWTPFKTSWNLDTKIPDKDYWDFATHKCN
ncbi:DUF2599 domain-containing protein [Actinomyces naeslundii]|jgi:putative secreted protein|uniref:DUF2599 domain-containing protein n=1 Tax=Actinomyces naeslundii TaxID=1655 RepID=UPI003C6F7B41